MKLKDLIKLANVLNELQGVERRVYVRGLNRRENDFEHSFQLAFFTWYFLNTSKNSLNQERAIKYALVHDLVEVYAGDAPFYFKTKHDERKKKQKESAALKRLYREIPAFQEGLKYLGKYGGKSDREAKFVSALDKFLPVLNIYLDGGRSWKKSRIDFTTLVKNKTEKLSSSKEIYGIFKELLVLLEKDKKKLFGKRKPQ